MYALQFQITQQLRLICLHCSVSSLEYLCLLVSFAWFYISLVKRSILERALLLTHMQVLRCFLPVTRVSRTQALKCMQILIIFIGIPLTIQSNRPSSRSSQRSTGSIGSYGRRSSGAMKGVNVSQSRQGSARSAAILLYSYQLSELKNPTQSSMPSMRSHSDEFMAKYIEQQLENQKKLLYLEIPALRNYNSLMRKLRLNPRSECDLTQLEAQSSRESMSKVRLNFFKRQPTTLTEFNNAVMGMDERSDDANLCLNSDQRTDLHRGFINPLAYSLNDLDDDDDDDDDNDDVDEKHRKYIIDNEEIFIGTLPSPASEAPSIAVMIDVNVVYIFICFSVYTYKKYFIVRVDLKKADIFTVFI